MVGSPSNDVDVTESLSLSNRFLRRAMSRTQSSSASSHSQATLQRFFSTYQSVSLDENRGLYRTFVDRGLKKRGLTRLMNSLVDFVHPILKLARYALTPISEREETDDVPEYSEEERRPLLRPFHSAALMGIDSYHQRHPVPTSYVRGTSVGPECWTQEFESMNLPLFCQQYIQLVHVPLDVMHECLKLQLELRPPQQPSPHSVKRVSRCRS